MNNYILERNKARKLNYEKNKQYAILKLGSHCIVCGEENHALLEFDHINPKTKSFGINVLLRSTKDKLDEELSKCQLLCHDCHLEKTTFERQLASDSKGVKHGTVNAYVNQGCRCLLCKKAGSDNNKKYYKK